MRGRISKESKSESEPTKPHLTKHFIVWDPQYLEMDKFHWYSSETTGGEALNLSNVRSGRPKEEEREEKKTRNNFRVMSGIFHLLTRQSIVGPLITLHERRVEPELTTFSSIFFPGPIVGKTSAGFPLTSYPPFPSSHIRREMSM